ncbi:MAG: hypothetical protein O7I93_18340 [Gemmatimonadetes bacterium]|nr:hypothetical protein [Gemmatimonadota bacterium]
MLRLYDTLGGRPDPDEELIRAIGSVRLRWRLKVAMRGLAIVVAAGLAVFLVSTYGMDKLRFTPTSVTVFRVLTYVAVLVLLIRFLVLPLLRSVSDRRVALYIEEREPSLQASLISAVEYREQGKDAGAANLSPALAGKLVQSAADRCRDIKFGHNIEQRALRRSSGALAGVAMAGLLLIVTSPGFMRTGAPFLLFPWSDEAAENPYAIEVLPGDTLLPRGADLRVNAQLLGFDAEDVTIAVKRGDAEWERWSMTVGRDPGAYEIFLFDLEDAAEYAIEASGVRSPVYSIEVADLPYVAQLDLEYRFPAYTGMSPLIQEDRGDIAALVGTNVVLTVTPTMTVTRGMIVIDGGDSIAMDVGGDGRLTGTLTVRSAGLYRIALDAFDGRMVVGSPDYVIDALTDQPPTIRFEKPGRDIKVTPVEEAFLEVKAEDDYGLRSVQLMYSVNGGPEDTLDLYTGMRRTTQMSAGHTFYLEEMNLEPGDLVSYYAQVADNDRVGGRQTTTSDIYFMEVRPFRRDYRQAEQGGGGGGGGGDGLDGQFSEQQRQIVAATFKMVRDRDQYADVEYRENMATLALSQGRLRERVEAVVRRIQDRGVMRSDSGFIKIMQELPAAAAEMLTSEEELGERDAREALPAAQRALQHLQRAEAAFRDVQVSMGQQGGGGGGQNQSNAEDLADLFELELDKMQNQYESVQRGEQRQVDREIDATMQRLEELARRQQQENERMRRRASSMQGQAGGGGGNQRQLAEQAEELARQLERLGREQSLDNLQDTARRLREAANAMRRAADSRRGSDLAEAQSALDRLQEARRLLERGRSERLNRDVQDALRRAERLVEQQDQMTEDVERLGAGGGRPSPEAMSRIMERKDELQREVSELETDLDRMAREWRDEQRDAARGLAGAAQSIRDNRLADKIRYSKGVVQQRTPEYARNFEEQIAADIEELRQRIEGAAGEIGENEGQRVGELLEDTRDLMQDLESLDERIQSQAERLQRGDDQGQQGSQQQGSQQQGGQQQGGREGRQAGQPGDRGGNPAGQTRGGFGGFDPGQVRQYRREFRERLGDLEELRQGLAREGIDVDPLDDVMALLRQLDSRGIFDDPAEIARLQRDVIEGLKEFEYALRRAFQSDDADRLLLSGSDEVPEGFRELVEEYYRSLSNRNR